VELGVNAKPDEEKHPNGVDVVVLLAVERQSKASVRLPSMAFAARAFTDVQAKEVGDFFV
jgi:hypothetical protein